ncbi:MAG: TetR family transcriptional regulator [Kutzneria sp.]|nr:TetR family transcriptional regulator [Kutzneria sp.]MBV9843584.1 TetR family transcriptional regulator [Kutzneria sp.]
MARSGRRPGESQTRDTILAAARKLFSAGGYPHTTVRDIAAEAGVNSALVHHFFGSKARLFAAAVAPRADPAEIVDGIADGPLSTMGVRIVRTFLRVWREREPGSSPLVALLRSATSDEATAVVRELVDRGVLSRLAEETGIPKVRLSAAIGQMIGLMVLRQVVALEPLASIDDEEIVALVAPVIQYYVDGG